MRGCTLTLKLFSTQVILTLRWNIRLEYLVIVLEGSNRSEVSFWHFSDEDDPLTPRQMFCYNRLNDTKYMHRINHTMLWNFRHRTQTHLFCCKLLMEVVIKFPFHYKVVEKNLMKVKKRRNIAMQIKSSQFLHNYNQDYSKHCKSSTWVYFLLNKIPICER